MQRSAASLAPDKSLTPPASTNFDVKPETALVWRVHLFREDPVKIAGVLAGALLAAAGAIVLFHSPLLGIVAALLLLVSVSEYLLPLTYTLDESGAKAACGPVEWLAIEWATVRSVYRTPDGIKLSPFKNPKTARLEQCRGIRLRVPPDRMADVRAMIECHFPGMGQW